MRTLIACLVFAVVLFTTGCGEDEGGKITVGGQEANDHGTEDVSGSDSAEFEMDDYYFEPTVVQGEPGQKVTLEAFNEGDEEHNLTIEDQDIDEDLESDEETEIEVTIPESGTVVFFCKYHESRGMRGALQATSG